MIAVILCGVLGLLWFTLIHKPFTYTDNGRSITITRWSDASGAVEIPSIINGKPVTCIGTAAFACCTHLTSITIPPNVTSIGDSAFEGTSLNSITIPPSVTSIGDSAFQGTSLTSINIPTSVTTIGNRAFNYCYGLSSITIPSSVTSIGDFAFFHCSGLTSITIPSGVTSIGNRAFEKCSSLTEIIVDPLNVKYSSLDGVLYNKNQTKLIQSPEGKAGSVTIPAGATGIGRMAFNDCVHLTNITIPNSVTSIGDYAFSGCTGLTSVTLPASITSIGDSAFSGCTGLTAITVDPHNANYSSMEGVLYDTNRATLILCLPCKVGSVIIPAGVTNINGSAFSGSTGLTSVTIPASITCIGEFSACTNLTEINVDSQNANYSSVDGILYSKDQTILLICPRGKSGSITLPSSVSGIGNLNGCTKLKAINVDMANANFSGLDGVLYNKNQTLLFQCPEGKIGSFTIPSSVTRIRDYAFTGCSGLSSVTIPASVTSIGSGAFFNCNSLTSANFLGNAPSMDHLVFDYTASDFTVYYLKGKTGFTSPIWNGYKAEVRAAPP